MTAIAIGRQIAVYSRTARVTHWLIAAIMLIVLPTGLVLNYLPEGPFRDYRRNVMMKPSTDEAPPRKKEIASRFAIAMAL